MEETNMIAHVSIPNNKEAKFHALFFVYPFFCLSSSNYRTMESFFCPDLYITRAHTS
jgi:hypothetical protein